VVGTGSAIPERAERILDLLIGSLAIPDADS
jgi:hypothetical protein